ncbi:Swt1 family HEPN domain-containing protein [Planctomicrobium piriforme]|uniref:Swt1-like HEPN domain-containing protein n=1 Tax=Planctomicrobium piriforme TaxID=1576369 RepID=A0A1I3FZD5_9PLAN|nr:Swt1 family HEPN domain-containing protein [Planctomicrobium piriforme]SFI16593.1 hypothetical protein SAMN05421753_106104 [Planctomicrobium piriforme]
MDLLTEGLAPYVEIKLRAVHQDNWVRIVSNSFRDDRGRVNGQSVDWDAQALLTVMWDQWNTVFRNELGHFERSLVSELREVRNRWAHQQSFEFDDAFRVLDSVDRLLTAIHAENVEIVKHEKSDLLESHVADAVNTQVQRNAFQRNKWWVIAIYTFCCGLIIVHGINAGKAGNYALISVVFLVFLYLIYQQFKMEPPLLFGPRECRRCHRIIYRKMCPYCEATE